MSASLFQWLNRLLRLAIAVGWCAAAYGVWTQRERARPAVDYYTLWRDAGWQRPDPLPRWSGEFRRPVSPGVVEAVDEHQSRWKFGLRGLATVNPEDPRHAATNRWFLRQTLTNLTRELAGLPIEIGTVGSAEGRTGSGFLYVDGHLVQAGWVRAGRYRLRVEDCRVLPLSEQYELRVAEREARRERLGLWSLPGAPVDLEP